MGNEFNTLDISGGMNQYTRLTNTLPNNTQGGTFSSGAWRLRNINTVNNDEFGNVLSLAAGAFTLSPGTYNIRASACANAVNTHKISIQPAGDLGNVLILGSAADASTFTTQTTAILNGVLVVTVPTAYELRHLCKTTKTTSGFGERSVFSISTVEIYATVILNKVA